ncbi:11401_t:CDS:2 [Diversispora eburnea]|uniref:11401_t:CDS:1 n=1 Tax=Diversispora eburnea TaxID=1213867 RepID=A0A9N8WJG7_9GLOM|nr:11401_t:CDS:2 [Diversispora eburnea]
MEKNPIDLIDKEKNVIIETGKFPEIKIFKANSNILKRTKYFRVALSNEWAKRNEDGYYIINKPNINPQTFEIILKFIDNDDNVQLNLLNINGTESIQLLIASDELELIKLSEM